MIWLNLKWYVAVFLLFMYEINNVLFMYEINNVLLLL